ncbi:MAG: TetR/AcrR family transcriptional regulator [Candidatus Cloacimonetes bacterium]|nr:TetR/AcrR family transcriptional regulator [Candidatus Cloacimonadota bacterium]
MTPRKPEKFAEMREKSRNQIIEKALEIFAEHGYYKTSIEMIAKAAGISKGLIYNYFKSKDELLEIVLMQGFNFFDEMSEISQPQISAYDRLQLLLDNFTKSLQENLTFWQLYQSVISQRSIMHKLTKFKEYYESVFGPLLMGIFVELFGNEMSEQEIQIEMMLFAAFLDGIAFDYVIMGEEYPFNDISEALLKKYNK